MSETVKIIDRTWPGGTLLKMMTTNHPFKWCVDGHIYRRIPNSPPSEDPNNEIVVDITTGRLVERYKKLAVMPVDLEIIATASKKGEDDESEQHRRDNGEDREVLG